LKKATQRRSQPQRTASRERLILHRQSNRRLLIISKRFFPSTTVVHTDRSALRQTPYPNISKQGCETGARLRKSVCRQQIHKPGKQEFSTIQLNYIMTSSSPTACRDPLVELLQTYEDLNSSIITELDSPPSALEFMRFVGQNRPFVVRGAAADWEAFKKWNVSFLKEALNGEKVNVAVTPFG